MKQTQIEQEWDVTPIYNIKYDAASAMSSISWLDSAKNIWLEAKPKNILLFKISNEPGVLEPDLAIYLSISEICLETADTYLKELGYSSSFVNPVRIQEKNISKLVHLHLESDISLELVCENIDIIEIKNPYCS